jgi:orotate phosphoribosyltransferase
LPQDIVAVAGSGRSGMLVASILGLERNIHTLNTDELAAGCMPWQEEKRRSCPAKTTGTILVVDDTICSGESLDRDRKWIGVRIFPDIPVQYGAVYAMAQSIKKVDHYFLDVGDTDHLFEWNWHHHWFLKDCLLDMDGVLCEDWPYTSEEGLLEEKYIKHFSTVKPLMKPSFEIGAIVTGRLEKYRPQTVAWLEENGIRYNNLIMNPAANPADRLLNGGPAKWKADVYAKHPDAILFVESCPHQAAMIASATKRPVLSYPEIKFYNGAM